MKAIVFSLSIFLVTGLYAQHTDITTSIELVKFSFKQTYLPSGLIIAETLVLVL